MYSHLYREDDFFDHDHIKVRKPDRSKYNLVKRLVKATGSGCSRIFREKISTSDFARSKLLWISRMNADYQSSCVLELRKSALRLKPGSQKVKMVKVSVSPSFSGCPERCIVSTSRHPTQNFKVLTKNWYVLPPTTGKPQSMSFISTSIHPYLKFTFENTLDKSNSHRIHNITVTLESDSIDDSQEDPYDHPHINDVSHQLDEIINDIGHHNDYAEISELKEATETGPVDSRSKKTKRSPFSKNARDVAPPFIQTTPPSNTNHSRQSSDDGDNSLNHPNYDPSGQLRTPHGSNSIADDLTSIGSQQTSYTHRTRRGGASRRTPSNQELVRKLVDLKRKDYMKLFLDDVHNELEGVKLERFSLKQQTKGKLKDLLLPQVKAILFPDIGTPSVRQNQQQLSDFRSIRHRTVAHILRQRKDREFEESLLSQLPPSNEEIGSKLDLKKSYKFSPSKNVSSPEMYNLVEKEKFASEKIPKKFTVEMKSEIDESVSPFLSRREFTNFSSPRQEQSHYFASPAKDYAPASKNYRPPFLYNAESEPKPDKVFSSRGVEGFDIFKKDMSSQQKNDLSPSKDVTFDDAQKQILYHRLAQKLKEQSELKMKLQKMKENTQSVSDSASVESNHNEPDWDDSKDPSILVEEDNQSRDNQIAHHDNSSQDIPSHSHDNDMRYHPKPENYGIQSTPKVSSPLVSTRQSHLTDPMLSPIFPDNHDVDLRNTHAKKNLGTNVKKPPPKSVSTPTKPKSLSDYMNDVNPEGDHPSNQGMDDESEFQSSLGDDYSSSAPSLVSAQPGRLNSNMNDNFSDQSHQMNPDGYQRTDSQFPPTMLSSAQHSFPPMQNIPPVSTQNSLQRDRSDSLGNSKVNDIVNTNSNAQDDNAGLNAFPHSQQNTPVNQPNTQQHSRDLHASTGMDNVSTGGDNHSQDSDIITEPLHHDTLQNVSFNQSNQQAMGPDGSPQSSGNYHDDQLSNVGKNSRDQLEKISPLHQTHIDDKEQVSGPPNPNFSQDDSNSSHHGTDHFHTGDQLTNQGTFSNQPNSDQVNHDGSIVSQAPTVQTHLNNSNQQDYQGYDQYNQPTGDETNNEGASQQITNQAKSQEMDQYNQQNDNQGTSQQMDQSNHDSGDHVHNQAQNDQYNQQGMNQSIDNLNQGQDLSQQPNQQVPEQMNDMGQQQMGQQKGQSQQIDQYNQQGQSQQIDQYNQGTMQPLQDQQDPNQQIPPSAQTLDNSSELTQGTVQQPEVDPGHITNEVMYDGYPRRLLLSASHQKPEYIQEMIRGDYFLKYHFKKKSAVAKRFIKLSDDGKFLLVQKSGLLKHTHKFPVADIKWIVFGPYSKTMKRRIVEHPWRCFSIVFPNRTIDLESLNDHDIDAWLLGLQSLVIQAMVQNHRQVYSKLGYRVKKIMLKLKARNISFHTAVCQAIRKVHLINAQNQAEDAVTIVSQFSDVTNQTENRRIHPDILPNDPTIQTLSLSESYDSKSVQDLQIVPPPRPPIPQGPPPQAGQES